MKAVRRRRVLVAVEPLVLEGALAAILDLLAVDEVVQYHGASEVERGWDYDAAIVTPGLRHVTRAEVVITLPDTASPSDGPSGQVSAGGLSQEVHINDQRQVIALLDQHAPAGRAGGDRMRRARERSLW